MGKKPKPLLYLSLLALIVLFYLGWKALAYPVQTVPVISQLDSMPPVPGMEEVPQGPEGDLIKKGYLYMVDTANQLPQYVGNKLSCSSCHADGGTGANLNLVGVNRIFPQYNSRSGQNIVLEDRIQQCFERSMAGTAPAKDSEEMKAMVAYINYISKNVPEGTKKRPWVVAPAIKGQLPSPNLANGEKLYQLGCASCHGVDGAGNGGGPTVGPALWGEDSFNIGAGMGRIRTAAGYIQRYMPKIQMGVHAPGTLTTQEAVDLAAYILSKPRPDLAKKEKDWPKNEQPDDVAYMTLAMRKAGMDEKSLPWYTAYAERAMKKAAQPVDSPSSDSESPQK
ncbi:c-type cytochrome [Thermicanus aegyptius]|uniref:c-type cytochrome n=1 Tax=Thermicanus aegyptius TaxID=94009 RepID=UPI001B7FDD26|nr:c-type cytochrome [Thermicanus aegyptius]